MKMTSRALGALVLASISSVALATGPDVSAITATLADVATVGTAVFGVYVAIKAVKFIRRAL